MIQPYDWRVEELTLGDETLYICAMDVVNESNDITTSDTYVFHYAYPSRATAARILGTMQNKFGVDVAPYTDLRVNYFRLPRQPHRMWGWSFGEYGPTCTGRYIVRSDND